MSADPEALREKHDDFNAECLFIPAYFPFNADDLEALVFTQHQEEQKTSRRDGVKIKRSLQKYTHYLQREREHITVAVYATKSPQPSCHIVITRTDDDDLVKTFGTHDMFGERGSLRDFFAGFAFRKNAFIEHSALFKNTLQNLEVWARVFHRLEMVYSEPLSNVNLMDRVAVANQRFQGLIEHLGANWPGRVPLDNLLTSLQRFRLRDPALQRLVDFLPFLDQADQKTLEDLLYIRDSRDSTGWMEYVAEELGFANSTVLRYVLAQPPLVLGFWFLALASRDSVFETRLGTAILLKEAHVMGGFYSRQRPEVRQLLSNLSAVDYRERPVVMSYVTALLHQLFREDYWRMRTVDAVEAEANACSMTDMLKVSEEARNINKATNDRFNATGALLLGEWLSLVGKESLSKAPPRIRWDDSSASEGEPESAPPVRVSPKPNTVHEIVSSKSSSAADPDFSPKPKRDESPKRRGRPRKMPIRTNL
jgi:hypothetical protein